MSGNFEESEALLREALTIQIAALPEGHPQTLVTMANLGSVLEVTGDFGGAESIQREVVSLRRRAYGDGVPLTVEGGGSGVTLG